MRRLLVRLLREQRGYSLMELLVSMSILGSVMTSVSVLARQRHQLGGRHEPPLPGSDTGTARARSDAPRGALRDVASRRREPSASVTLTLSPATCPTSGGSTRSRGARSRTGRTAGASGATPAPRAAAPASVRRLRDRVVDLHLHRADRRQARLPQLSAADQRQAERGAVPLQPLDDIVLRNAPARDAARLADEGGFSPRFTLRTCSSRSCMLTAVIQFTTSNSGHATRSKADQIAYALAEAGLATRRRALEAVEQRARPERAPEQRAQRLEPCARELHLPVRGRQGEVVGRPHRPPVDHARRRLRQPTRPGRTQVVRREATSTIKIQPSLKQELNSNAWNYMSRARTRERLRRDDLEQRQRRHIALHHGRPLPRELVLRRQGGRCPTSRTSTSAMTQFGGTGRSARRRTRSTWRGRNRLLQEQSAERRPETPCSAATARSRYDDPFGTPPAIPPRLSTCLLVRERESRSEPRRARRRPERRRLFEGSPAGGEEQQRRHDQPDAELDTAAILRHPAEPDRPARRALVEQTTRC